MYFWYLTPILVNTNLTDPSFWDRGSWLETFLFQFSRLFPDSLIPESGPKDRFLDRATPPILKHDPADSQATRACQETGRHRFSHPPFACSLNRHDYPQWPHHLRWICIWSLMRERRDVSRCTKPECNSEGPSHHPALGTITITSTPSAEIIREYCHPAVEASEIGFGKRISSIEPGTIILRWEVGRDLYEVSPFQSRHLWGHLWGSSKFRNNH